MKTKNFFRIALVAGMVSFAAAASAQNFNSEAQPSEVDDVAATQVDYVTVGATMPYATDTTQGDLAAWKANVAAAGLTAAITTETKWFVGTSELASALNLPAIKVDWATEGEYTVKVQTNIKLGGTAACDPAEQVKKVYVLPEPVVEFTDGGGAVLPCTTNTHTLKFKTVGIGQKQLKYTVTKKLFADAATTDPEATATPVGTGIATEGNFAETVSHSDATDHYSASALSGATKTNIDLTGLAAGYVYTVQFTEVSDQISRKSNVTVTPENAAATVSFAIVPEPVNTKINHVKNVE